MERVIHDTTDANLSARTGYTDAPKMLVDTFGVVARATCRFVLAKWLLGINLVTKRWGQEATCNRLRKIRVVAI
jgi:hypothetical protein